MITILTSGHSNAVTNSYTTASVAPLPNALVLVFVGANTSNAATPTLSGASLTFDQIATCSSTSNNPSMTAFKSLSASPGSGALTISFSANQANVYWIVLQITNTDITGSNGAGAIVQSATHTLDATTSGDTVNLNPFQSPINLAIGAINNNGVLTLNVGTGFTELVNIADAQSFEGEYARNIPAVSWTWVNTNLKTAAIAVEIKLQQGDLLLAGEI